MVWSGHMILVGLKVKVKRLHGKTRFKEQYDGSWLQLSPAACLLGEGLEAVGGWTPCSQDATGEPQMRFQRDGTVLGNDVLLKPKCFNKVPSRKEKRACWHGLYQALPQAVSDLIPSVLPAVPHWGFAFHCCLLRPHPKPHQKMDFFQRAALKVGNILCERWKSFVHPESCTKRRK